MAHNRKEAVLRLLDDAADDIAAATRAKQDEIALHDEAVALVQRFLPSYRASSEPFGPFLVFTPAQIIELVDAVEELCLIDESAYDEDAPWRSLPRSPS